MRHEAERHPFHNQVEECIVAHDSASLARGGAEHFPLGTLYVFMAELRSWVIQYS